KSQLPDVHYSSDPPSAKNSRIDLSLSIMGQDIQLPPPRTPTEPRRCERPRPFTHSVPYYINDEAQDDLTVLHNNLEELLMCHSVGIPIEIIKRDFKPGSLAAPVFHCPRCLGHWKEYGLLPDKCDEPALPTRGPFYRLNTHSSDLLQNLSEVSEHHHENTTTIVINSGSHPIDGRKDKYMSNLYSDLSLESDSKSSVPDDSTSAKLNSRQATVKNRKQVGAIKTGKSKSPKSKEQKMMEDDTRTDSGSLDDEYSTEADKNKTRGKKKSLGHSEKTGLHAQKNDSVNEDLSTDLEQRTTGNEAQQGTGLEPNINDVMIDNINGHVVYNKSPGNYKAVGQSGVGHESGKMGQYGPDGSFYPGAYEPDGTFKPVGRIGKDGKFYPITIGPDGRHYINETYGPDGTFYPGEQVGFKFATAAEFAAIQNKGLIQESNSRGPDGNYYPHGKYEANGTFRPGGPPQPKYGPDGKLLRGAIGTDGQFYANGHYGPDGTFFPGGQIGPDGIFYPKGNWVQEGFFVPNNEPIHGLGFSASTSGGSGSYAYDQCPYTNNNQDADDTFSGCSTANTNNLPVIDSEKKGLSKIQHYEYINDSNEDMMRQQQVLGYHDSNSDDEGFDSVPVVGEVDKMNPSYTGKPLRRRRKMGKHVNGTCDGGRVEGIQEDIAESEDQDYEYDYEEDVVSRDTDVPIHQNSEGYHSGNNSSRENSKTGDVRTLTDPYIMAGRVRERVIRQIDTSIYNKSACNPKRMHGSAESRHSSLATNDTQESELGYDEQEEFCKDENCKVKGKHKHTTTNKRKQSSIVTLKEGMFDLPTSRRSSLVSDIETGITTSKSSGITSSAHKGKKNIKNHAVRNVTGKPDTRRETLGKHVFSGPATAGSRVTTYAGILDEKTNSSSSAKSTKEQNVKQRPGQQKAVASKIPNSENDSEVSNSNDEDSDDNDKAGGKGVRRRQVIKKTAKRNRKVIRKNRVSETGQGDQSASITTSSSSANRQRRDSSMMLAEPMAMSSRPGSLSNVYRCNSNITDEQTRMKYSRSTIPSDSMNASRKRSKEIFDELMKRSSTLPKVPQSAGEPLETTRKRSPTKEELIQLKRSTSSVRYTNKTKRDSVTVGKRSEAGSKIHGINEPNVLDVGSSLSDESLFTMSPETSEESICSSVSRLKSDVDLPNLASLSVLDFTRSYTFSFFTLPEHYRERNEKLQKAANPKNRKVKAAKPKKR
ncbi:uncharacterized protein LOC144350438, partial [Saccoglossus kowalevskii]